MWSILTWAIVLVVAAVVGYLGLVVVRAYRSGSTPSEILFRTKPEPRMQVVEVANMDGRRKLLLIRRDDVEHLIMTGGPVDMVIETGIGEKKRGLRATDPASAPPPLQTATVLTRPARTLGQASGGGSSGGEGA